MGRYFFTTMLEQINTWLSAPDDYRAGLSLLKQTGFGGFTLSILEKGDDAYTRTRLETELRKWAGAQQNVLPIATPAPMETVESSVPRNQTSDVVIPKKPTSGLPEAVTELHQHRGELMDERGHLKARIYACRDDESRKEDRRQWAYRIKAITRELDEVFSQLDFFGQHGYLPLSQPAPADPDDTAALVNVRTYVSRYKAKLKKKNLTPEQRQSAQALLKQYEAEKNRLELKRTQPQWRTNHDLNSTGQQTTHCPDHSDPKFILGEVFCPNTHELMN